jgi:hypothetical protein
VVIFRTTAAVPQNLHRFANHLLSTVVVRVGARCRTPAPEVEDGLARLSIGSHVDDDTMI